MINIFFGLNIVWIAIVLVRYSELGITSFKALQLVTLLAPLTEFVLWFIIFNAFKSASCLVVKIIQWIFSLIFSTIITIQFYYFYVSGEFITTLALENAEQAYLLIDYKFLLMCLVNCMIWGTLIICNNNIKSGGQKTKIFSVILLVIIFVQNYAFKIDTQKKVLASTPIFDFTKVVYHYIKEEYFSPYAEVKSYPFIKEMTYNNKLSFEKKIDIDKPNVIILFTEGTSARLLECYGGKFDKLTPNISNFSQNSNTLIIKNYYNHTAATFRGTHGQLASCYPLRGGYGQGQWADANNKDIFSKMNYQTLPAILNKYGYKTLFLSPHMEKDPYTSLLRMLKFQKVQTLKNYQMEYGNVNLYHESLQDKDMYKWIKDTLSSFHENEHVLLCAYTFETHTGVDVASNNEKYIIDNPSLNTLHNMDASFGEFWNWFRQSRFAQNTIVILTADHAHYYAKDYVALVNNEYDYKNIFVDKIPLLIYDPIHNLPKKMDAKGRTSLDLTPTILHLLSIQNEKNSFLGHSLFENSNNVNIAALGREFYLIKDGDILYKQGDFDNLSADDKSKFQLRKEQIELFYNAEKYNKIFKDN